MGSHHAPGGFGGSKLIRSRVRERGRKQEEKRRRGRGKEERRKGGKMEKN